MADYGQLNPMLLGGDAYQQMAQLQRQQALASALTQEGMTPINPLQSSGRYIVPVSPWQGAAKIGQALAGALVGDRVARKEGQLQGMQQQTISQAMARALQAKDVSEMAPQDLMILQTYAPKVLEEKIAMALAGPKAKAVAEAEAPYKLTEMSDNAAKWKVDALGHEVPGTRVPLKVSPEAEFKSKEEWKRTQFVQGQENERHRTPAGFDPSDPAQQSQYMAQAQGIAEGRLPPPSPFQMMKPSGQYVMSLVAQIKPDYDATGYGTHQKAEKDFGTGKQGNTVRSLNVATQHLDTLEHSIDAMNNGNFPLVNQIANQFGYQTGNTAKSNFDAIKHIVADEVVKAVVGSGGALADREAAAKQIDAAKSPEQLRGVIRQFKELMGGQLVGLKQQYESAGGKNFDRFLTPGTPGGSAPAAGGEHSLQDLIDEAKSRGLVK